MPNTLHLGPVSSVESFYAQVGTATGRRVRNLDALFDVLSDTPTTHISCEDWGLDWRASISILRVLRDLGISLKL